MKPLQQKPRRARTPFVNFHSQAGEKRTRTRKKATNDLFRKCTRNRVLSRVDSRTLHSQFIFFFLMNSLVFTEVYLILSRQGELQISWILPITWWSIYSFLIEKVRVFIYIQSYRIKPITLVSNSLKNNFLNYFFRYIIYFLETSVFLEVNLLYF